MLALQEFTGPGPNMGNLAANAGATLIASITIISATIVNNTTMRRISAASFPQDEAYRSLPSTLFDAGTVANTGR
jgi:hypothetical protein